MQPRFSLTFVSVGLALAFVAAAALSAAADAGQEQKNHDAAVAGRKIFLENCATCHGLDARGNGPTASSLKGVPPDLSQIEVRHRKFSEYEIQQMILGEPTHVDAGGREMPAWGRLFRQEGGDGLAMLRTHTLVSYLESIQAR